MNWNKFSTIIIGITFLILISLIGTVHAVKEIGTNYEIECTPDDATIQFNGYTQYCSYLWKGTQNITRDVAFCFGTTINSAKVQYLNNNGNYIDITNQFNYKHYNFNKGECYYIQKQQVIFVTCVDVLYLNLKMKKKLYAGSAKMNQGRICENCRIRISNMARHIRLKRCGKQHIRKKDE